MGWKSIAAKEREFVANRNVPKVMAKRTAKQRASSYPAKKEREKDGSNKAANGSQKLKAINPARNTLQNMVKAVATPSIK
jgi:hypothetical protein